MIEKIKENFFLGMIIIVITLLGNFFLVKWSLADRIDSFHEKRLAHLLRATDYLFTALEHSEKKLPSDVKKERLFIKSQLNFARKELMSKELRALRVKLQRK